MENYIHSIMYHNGLKSALTWWASLGTALMAVARSSHTTRTTRTRRTTRTTLTTFATMNALGRPSKTFLRASLVHMRVAETGQTNKVHDHVLERLVINHLPMVFALSFMLLSFIPMNLLLDFVD